MKAVAFSNNDIALIAWTYDRHLPGCIGFSVQRRAAGSHEQWEPLPALARFKNSPPNEKGNTDHFPIQKFWWKDLNANHGDRCEYRIVPMGGKPGSLVPLDEFPPLVSNVVTVSGEYGQFKVCFNRGIVASQAVVRKLGSPNKDKLLELIENPEDPIRQSLSGQLMPTLTELLDRADADGAQICAALYELNDPDGLEVKLQAAESGNPKLRTVILGNERDQNGLTPLDKEDKCHDNRENLKKAHVPVIDRILPPQRIPHNKFLILKEGEEAKTVLTGSTNWTMTGLATQTNNALIIESPRIAQYFYEYWKRLQVDSNTASEGKDDWQSQKLREWTRDCNQSVIESPIEIEDGSAKVEIHFSPNTEKPLRSPRKSKAKKPTKTKQKPQEPPVDMARLFSLVNAAKSAVLFLAFDPGNNSILEAAAQALSANPQLFVRGALTNRKRSLNFKKVLEQSVDGDDTDQDSEDADENSEDGPSLHTALLSDRTSKKRDSAMDGADEPDYRAIPAGKVYPEDVFGNWEAELQSAGFAIIHDKIVVIDPFDENCVVILGSHNLGYRASHNNDENMVIIHGHRRLAEAYACHVLDVYDHFSWRYWLHKYKSKFGRSLREDDEWQDEFLDGDIAKSPELKFWLQASSVQFK